MQARCQRQGLDVLLLILVGMPLISCSLSLQNFTFSAIVIRNGKLIKHFGYKALNTYAAWQRLLTHGAYALKIRRDVNDSEFTKADRRL
jgi:hypothetical protein